MKRLILAIAIAGALWGGVTVGSAAPPAPSSVRTYQSGSGEHQYVIPASGSYCFNAAPDLPVDLPVCGVNPHQAVAPDPSIGPVMVPAG